MPDPSTTPNDLPAKFDRFLHASEPWVSGFVGDESVLVSTLSAWQASHPEVRVYTLDGRQMCWGADYEDELERGLGLPGYYGRNFDALDECLTEQDVLGLQPIVVVVLQRRPGALARVTRDARQLSRLAETRRAGVGHADRAGRVVGPRPRALPRSAAHTITPGLAARSVRPSGRVRRSHPPRCQLPGRKKHAEAKVRHRARRADWAAAAR